VRWWKNGGGSDRESKNSMEQPYSQRIVRDLRRANFWMAERKAILYSLSLHGKYTFHGTNKKSASVTFLSIPISKSSIFDLFENFAFFILFDFKKNSELFDFF
jgi:hypothetical protein